MVLIKYHKAQQKETEVEAGLLRIRNFTTRILISCRFKFNMAGLIDSEFIFRNSKLVSVLGQLIIMKTPDSG